MKHILIGWMAAALLLGLTAFALCRELTLSVPDSVTEIGVLAFNQVPQVYYSDPLGTGYPWGAYQIN